MLDYCAQNFKSVVKTSCKDENNSSKRVAEPSTPRVLRRQCLASSCFEMDFKTVALDGLEIPACFSSPNLAFLSISTSFKPHSKMAIAMRDIKVQYNGCDSFVEAAASRRIKRHESSRITRSSHMLNIV